MYGPWDKVGWKEMLDDTTEPRREQEQERVFGNFEMPPVEKRWIQREISEPAHT